MKKKCFYLVNSYVSLNLSCLYGPSHGKTISYKTCLIYLTIPMIPFLEESYNLIKRLKNSTCQSHLAPLDVGI